MNKLKRSQISSMAVDEVIDGLPLTVISHGRPVYKLSAAPSGDVLGTLPLTQLSADLLGM